MTPDISAETWLGAAGCARGSQTWRGTTPALVAKPPSAKKNSVVRVAPSRSPAAARRAAKSNAPAAEPLPSSWGWTVLVVGTTSAVLGVLYALQQHDLKRLLAFHSVENIGSILIGVGL